jgi:sugar/nucleoside kinase (ribokinase family)
VHISSFFLLHGLRTDAAGLLAEARAAGATTSLDPNWDPDEDWDHGLQRALRELDVLFANGEEAKRIAGVGDVENAARTLASAGTRVVVKLGSEGALAVEADTVLRARALEVDVVDTVGAGDSFNAGFLAGFLDGRDAKDCLGLACVCGSLSTRAAGGTAAQPTLVEATAR